MRESLIEKRWCKKVKDLGGRADKYKTPGRRHAPDRINLFPKEQVFFVEFKATGETLTDGQRREHQRLADLGFRVYMCNAIFQIHNILMAERLL